MNFAIGSYFAAASVTIHDDATAESTEYLNLSLAAASSGYPVDSSGGTSTLAIPDNDSSSGTIKFTTDTYSVSENVGTGLFTTSDGANNRPSTERGSPADSTTTTGT